MSCKRTDSEFSREIRERDGWCCQRCGRDFSGFRDGLHCSHFHSRRHTATRFDPDNCTALCFECHFHLDRHKTEYRTWKEAQLGPERFEALRLRAAQIVKKVRRHR